MHRLFVAIDFPDPVVDRLAALRAGVPGARWVEREQLHLTVRFIGEVEGPLFHDIVLALLRVRVPGFAIRLKGVGHFPPAGAPRVLWAGIEANPALAGLHRRIESVLVGQGVAPEKRRFAPHVTLARLKNARPARVAPFLVAHALFACPPVEVDAFHLYSSRLGSARAIHRIEASYPLGASVPAPGSSASSSELPSIASISASEKPR